MRRLAHREMFSRTALALVVILVFAACSVTTAHLTDFSITKQKGASESATSFAPRDTIYAAVFVANNPGKAAVQFHMIAENVQGQTPNVTVPQAEQSYDVDNDATVSYSVSAPNAGWLAGTYRIEAALVIDGKRQEVKSGEYTVAASGDATSGDTVTTAADPGPAIRRFAAGEDAKFSNVKGAFSHKDGPMSYYASSLTLPGARACEVYAYEKSPYAFATCSFDAATEADARALYAVWTQNVLNALPGWKLAAVNPMPSGDIVATVARDAADVHGVYLYVDKTSSGNYRLTVTFGTIAAIAS
jgi:hypothetical protein